MTQIQSAESQKMQFMNLLVEQLKNQNPLEPMDNQDMAAQLAQFTQLELTEESNTNIKDMTTSMNSMNSSFQGAMILAEMDYARSYLGKEVTFDSVDVNQTVSGTVKKVSFDGEQPMLEVEGTYKLPNGDDSEVTTFAVSPILVRSLQ